MYSTSTKPIRQRAHELLSRLESRFSSSPVQDCIRVAPAANDEQQANLVSLQIRKWLADGLVSIAVVTENRKLARRIRALLERANIHIQDSAGWALSTTSAAAGIERWLQTVEEDFNYIPLLDLLKMDLIHTALTENDFRHLIFRFEQDIIVHEKVTRNLQRYRKHIHYRLKRLHWPKDTSDALFQLLDLFQEASQPLLKLMNGKNHSAVEFIDGLSASLLSLGMQAKLLKDAAGLEIIKQLHQLRISATSNPLTLNWLEFRSWLGYCLENTYFKPLAVDRRVQLCNLEQSHLGRFDAIVIAAVEQEYLPGERSASPYFNDRVREELGLRTWKQNYHTRMYWFRELLESAPHVLLTYAQEKEGTEILKSPWLNALQTFHWLSYNDELLDKRLVEQNSLSESQVTNQHSVDLPIPSDWPSSVLPKALIPKSMSAASHQRLVDCPYKFFLADGLRLAPLEVIQQALEKSDYGERVHQSLEVFHSEDSPYSGALDRQITAANRQEAINLLAKITADVFSKDLEDNFLHRGWLKRWLNLIPSYIDWQMEQQAIWRVHETESRQKCEIQPGLLLNGRLDRIDTDSQKKTRIIDYKTGSIPPQSEVDQGEAIQLLTYALLMETAQQIEYVKISDPKVATAASVSQPELDELRGLTLERLSVVLEQIAADKPLPAWGDEKICQHCKMDGICRKQTWLHTPQ